MLYDELTPAQKRQCTKCKKMHPPGPAAREMYRMAEEAGVLVPCPQCESKEETT